MNSLKAMYGCGLNFFIKLAYNSLFLYKFVKKKENMIQQAFSLNQAQLQLLDMMSFIKTPEALRDLNKVISDYFVKKADEEMTKMWNEGTLNEEKIESFRNIHERTAYKKPVL